MSFMPLNNLRMEVSTSPRDVGARLRLGTALREEGKLVEAASHLQLAARLEPGNPHVALLATDVMVDAGREREAALLLSSHVRPQRSCTQVAVQEIELLESLLRHPEPYVRCHTARALGRLRIAQCLGALEKSCRDVDGAVRLAAMTSLRQLMAH